MATQRRQRMRVDEIHEGATRRGRGVFYQIPAARRGSPTSWKGHFYGRDHENLCPLNLHELEQIRKQALPDDWSAAICEGATLHDLEPNAIAFARQEFKKKNQTVAAEVPKWKDETVPKKAKGLKGGRNSGWHL